MEHVVNLRIEKLPEGVYLATSEDVPGLVAQGRTITETLKIARDVARKLVDAQDERSDRMGASTEGRPGNPRRSRESGNPAPFR